MKGRALLAATVALLLGAAVPAARAVDGCVVLLCLAGNWSAIPQCVPPVEQLFADLALGQPFPTCAFASAPSLPASSTVANTVATAAQATGMSGPTFSNLEGLAQQNCPVQYVVEFDGQFLSCSGYIGVINVTVNGVPWSQTLWSLGGASVTCYSNAAETALGISNTPCDQALAAYNARLAAAASTNF